MKALSLAMAKKIIIYIADPEIFSIPIIECNEPLIDIKNRQELLHGSRDNEYLNKESK